MKQENVKNQVLEQELSDEELDGAAGGRVGELSEGERKLVNENDQTLPIS